LYFEVHFLMKRSVSLVGIILCYFWQSKGGRDTHTYLLARLYSLTYIYSDLELLHLFITLEKWKTCNF